MATLGARIERILFPTDFSPVSEQAFRYALALTRRFQSRLRVLHVIPRGLPAEEAFASAVPWLLPPEVRHQAEEEMCRFLAPARTAGVDQEVEICDGDVWREIVLAAEEMKADFVVLGTHGRRGLEHLFLGSVTERLIPRLSCPVLTVGRGEGRAWEPEEFVRRILCATDFSRTSAEALSFSIALAAESQAKVTLLHVMESIPEPGEPAYFSVPEMAPFREEQERRAKEQLQRAVDGVAGSGTSVTMRTVVGRAYKEILRVASEERSDLIVLGAQGHGPLEHLFFGSNALHVIRRASCPVLTARPRAGSDAPAAGPSGGLVSDSRLDTRADET